MGGVGAGSHGQVQNLKNKGDRTTFKKKTWKNKIIFTTRSNFIQELHRCHKYLVFTSLL